MVPTIVYPRPRPAAEVRLFCVPYSGGGASAFRAWGSEISDRIEIAAVQLPGREERLADPPYTDLHRLTHDLCTAVTGHLDRPYALFGHSIGARVAFLLAHEVNARGLPAPVRLTVSANPAPSLGIRETTWTLSDEDLTAWLRDLGGTPPSVLDLPELVELLLPTIRADLALAATWVDADRPRLPVPMRTMVGRDDTYATAERARPWARETAAGCDHTDLPGGHFFLHDERPSVLGIIADDLLTSTDVQPASTRSR